MSARHGRFAAHGQPRRVVHLRGRGVFQYATNPAAMMDAIRGIARATLDLPSEVIVHVKDGKPLTAEGARLLGVPWPREKAEVESGSTAGGVA
jgi:hypothetical protein